VDDRLPGIQPIRNEGENIRTQSPFPPQSGGKPPHSTAPPWTRHAVAYGYVGRRRRRARGRVGNQRVAPLVDAADNLAYRLAYNSCAPPMTSVARCSPGDGGRDRRRRALRAIAAAVRRRDAAAAERLARELIQRGERGIKTALRQLDEEDARA
jgi:hypothetical protein